MWDVSHCSWINTRLDKRSIYWMSCIDFLRNLRCFRTLLKTPTSSHLYCSITVESKSSITNFHVFFVCSVSGQRAFSKNGTLRGKQYAPQKTTYQIDSNCHLLWSLAAPSLEFARRFWFSLDGKWLIYKFLPFDLKGICGKGMLVCLLEGDRSIKYSLQLTCEPGKKNSYLPLNPGCLI